MKTKEELLLEQLNKGFGEELRCKRLSIFFNNTEHLKSILAAMEEYASQSKWIDVKERLPEKDKEVLVANGKSVYCLTHHISSMGNWYAYGESRANTLITHWMNLPEPHKA